MLRIMDRIEHDNKNKGWKPALKKLCTVDCVPQKKDGFIAYVSNLTKMDKSKVEELWNQVVSYKERQHKDKLGFKWMLVVVCGGIHS